MKKIKFSFTILLCGLLISCSNSTNSKKMPVSDSVDKSDSLVVNIERVYGEFDLCEPDSSLYPILDAVVNSAKNCPELKNKGLLYSMWIYKDEDSLTRVNIELKNQKQMYCLSIDKIFTYKHAIFEATTERPFDHLYRSTGLKVKYLCMKENALMGDNDDRMLAHWEYI